MQVRKAFFVLTFPRNEKVLNEITCSEKFSVSVNNVKAWLHFILNKHKKELNASAESNEKSCKHKNRFDASRVIGWRSLYASFMQPQRAVEWTGSHQFSFDGAAPQFTFMDNSFFKQKLHFSIISRNDWNSNLGEKIHFAHRSSTISIIQ